jgi:cation transport protein ChaC
MALLTRDLITSEAYLEHFDTVPKEILWTRSRINNSLAEMMRARPSAADIWIFGYGSLIWNPLLNFDRQHWAVLQGWHRGFCLRMIAGRGSLDRPGRMLALEPGGMTRGVAFRLPDLALHEELSLVWTREMMTDVYRPIWSTVTLEDGNEATAIAFVVDPTHPLYEQDASIPTVAPIISAAAGSLGTNADYLFKLQSALTAKNAKDAYVEALADAVRRLSPNPLDSQID